MTHYTHKTEGGLFRLLDDHISVDGLDQPLVQYCQPPDATPRLMLKDKWQAALRPLLPLECHHCGGTGKEPGKAKAPCGYCFGSGLLDAQGNAITQDAKTSDLLKELVHTLRQQIQRQQQILLFLRGLPGVAELERQHHAEIQARSINPPNSRGPHGSHLAGD